MILFGATFMREQGDFTTAQSDFNAARGDSESPTRAVLGAELARRGRVLSERGKVGKGAERKVKNHFIDHSYHFIPNALSSPPQESTYICSSPGCVGPRRHVHGASRTTRKPVLQWQIRWQEKGWLWRSRLTTVESTRNSRYSRRRECDHHH